MELGIVGEVVETTTIITRVTMIEITETTETTRGAEVMIRQNGQWHPNKLCLFQDRNFCNNFSC